MKFVHKLSALGVISFAPHVYAWGSLGHETVAYIATNFVSDSTRSLFQEILRNNSESYLAGVATWADSYRYTEEGRFSAPYHFIDAEDHPPETCGVNFNRDCGKGGCVIAAIKNYTNQVLDTSLDDYSRYVAAKFVVHFVGDIHQPLHDEAVDLGGNGINVTFDGVPANLHAIWDTNMPEKLVGGYSLAYAAHWALKLSAEINSGAYSPEAASWLTGITLSDPESTALIWAEQANAFVCTTVLPGGVEAVEGQELGGAYYESSVPVIQLQIARAGYRLAYWLDLIADYINNINTEL